MHGRQRLQKFLDFQQKCVNAYWVLRENARVIVNMFYLMIDSGIPELNNIDNLKALPILKIFLYYIIL